NRFVAVDYDLAPVPQSAVWKGVIEEGTKWAYPKEDDAKSKMKKVVLSYEKPKEWADSLSKFVEERFDLQRVSYDFCKVISEFLSGKHPARVDPVAKMRDDLEKNFPGKRRLIYTMPMSA